MELDNNQSLDSLVNDGAPSATPDAAPAPAPDVPPSFEPGFNPNPEPTPTSAPMGGPSIIEDKPKNGNKMVIIAIVFAVLVALGGIGFGIFQMTAVSKKDSEIKNLKTQISNLSNVSSEEAEDKEEAATLTLPIISSADGGYFINFTSSGASDTGVLTTITSSIKDGKIASCSIQTKTTSGEESAKEDCKISDLPGDIYKGIQVLHGQEVADAPILFLMTDGSVYYVLPSEFKDTKEVSVKSKLNISGPVADVVTVGTGENGAEGFETVFVLKDGTIIKYDESLLKAAE